MGENIFKQAIFTLANNITQKAIDKNSPIVIEVIDEYGDSISLSIISSLFNEIGTTTVINYPYSTLNLLRKLWKFPSSFDLIKQKLPQFILLINTTQRPIHDTAVKPSFGLVLSLDHQSNLNELTTAIGSPKKIFISPSILETHPDIASKKYSIIDHSAINVTLNHKISGTIVTIIDHTSEKDYTITIPNILLPESAAIAIEGTLLLFTLLKIPFAEIVNVLETCLQNQAHTTGISEGRKNTIILDASNSTHSEGLLLLSSYQQLLAKKEKKRKIVILGDQTKIERSMLKKTDILILTGESQKKDGIQIAETAGFVINENLYWFSDGKQLSFHITEVIEENAVILFIGTWQDHLDLAIQELTRKAQHGNNVT